MNSAFANGNSPKTLDLETKAVVTCKKGFVKSGGGEEIKCGMDGQLHWTFGKIFCRPVTCRDPRSLHFNGSHKTISREIFAISSNLSFTCGEGLVLVGEAMLTCQSDGNWSSSVPYCKYNNLLLFSCLEKVSHWFFPNKCFFFFQTTENVSLLDSN